MENEKIGNVNLNYKYYSGEDLYSDGDIEDELLEIVKGKKIHTKLKNDTRWPILYHLSDIRENIIEWYPIKKDETVLEIGSGCGAITGILSKKASKVTCIELSKKRSVINAYKNQDCDNVEIIVGNFQTIESDLEEKYDYITLIGVWEYSELYISSTDEPYISMLQIVKKHLKENGKIIIAIENKMGLKYWNGAREDHTGKCYESLGDYVSSNGVRTFSKKEIEKILDEIQLENRQFYYPTPDYKMPDMIYSDNYMPSVAALRDFGTNYDCVRVYNFSEAILCDQVCYDEMFNYFSNSFLVVIGEEKNEICFVKYSRQRKRKYQIKTMCYCNDNEYIITKEALTKKATCHVKNMLRNEMYSNNGLRKIKVLKSYMEENTLISPYICGKDIDTLFYEVRNDAYKFVDKLKKFVQDYMIPEDEMLKKFEKTKEYIKIFGDDFPEKAYSLEHTNVDMILSNIKITKNHELYCFDSEWIFDFPIPYKYVIWRSVLYLYYKYNTYLKNKLSLSKLMGNMGISENDCKIFKKMEKHFMEYVHGKNEDELYAKKYKKASIMQEIRFYE